MGELEDIKRRLKRLEKKIEMIDKLRCFFTDSQARKIKEKLK